MSDTNKFVPIGEERIGKDLADSLQDNIDAIKDSLGAIHDALPSTPNLDIKETFSNACKDTLSKYDKRQLSGILDTDLKDRITVSTIPMDTYYAKWYWLTDMTNITNIQVLASYKDYVAILVLDSSTISLWLYKLFDTGLAIVGMYAKDMWFYQNEWSEDFTVLEATMNEFGCSMAYIENGTLYLGGGANGTYLEGIVNMSSIPISDAIINVDVFNYPSYLAYNNQTQCYIDIRKEMKNEIQYLSGFRNSTKELFSIPYPFSVLRILGFVCRKNYIYMLVLNGEMDSNNTKISDESTSVKLVTVNIQNPENSTITPLGEGLDFNLAKSYRFLDMNGQLLLLTPEFVESSDYIQITLSSICINDTDNTHVITTICAYGNIVGQEYKSWNYAICDKYIYLMAIQHAGEKAYLDVYPIGPSYDLENKISIEIPSTGIKNPDNIFSYVYEVHPTQHGDFILYDGINYNIGALKVRLPIRQISPNSTMLSSDVVYYDNQKHDQRLRTGQLEFPESSYKLWKNYKELWFDNIVSSLFITIGTASYFICTLDTNEMKHIKIYHADGTIITESYDELQNVDKSNSLVYMVNGNPYFFDGYNAYRIYPETLLYRKSTDIKALPDITLRPLYTNANHVKFHQYCNELYFVVDCDFIDPSQFFVTSTTPYRGSDDYKYITPENIEDIQYLIIYHRISPTKPTSFTDYPYTMSICRQENMADVDIFPSFMYERSLDFNTNSLSLSLYGDADYDMEDSDPGVLHSQGHVLSYLKVTDGNIVRKSSNIYRLAETWEFHYPNQWTHHTEFSENYPELPCMNMHTFYPRIYNKKSISKYGSVITSMCRTDAGWIIPTTDWAQFNFSGLDFASTCGYPICFIMQDMPNGEYDSTYKKNNRRYYDRNHYWDILLLTTEGICEMDSEYNFHVVNNTIKRADNIGMIDLDNGIQFTAILDLEVGRLVTNKTSRYIIPSNSPSIFMENIWCDITTANPYEDWQVFASVKPDAALTIRGKLPTAECSRTLRFLDLSDYDTTSTDSKFVHFHVIYNNQIGEDPSIQVYYEETDAVTDANSLRMIADKKLSDLISGKEWVNFKEDGTFEIRILPIEYSGYSSHGAKARIANDGTWDYNLQEDLSDWDANIVYSTSCETKCSAIWTE